MPVQYTVNVTGVADGVLLGSNPYVNGSELGKAAVHAGILQIGQIGPVQVTVLDNFPQSYSGSTQNNIASSPYPFSVPGFSIQAAPNPPVVGASVDPLTPTTIDATSLCTTGGSVTYTLSGGARQTAPCGSAAHFPDLLPGSQYAITATQTVNGATSLSSAAVLITIPSDAPAPAPGPAPAPAPSPPPPPPPPTPAPAPCGSCTDVPYTAPAVRAGLTRGVYENARVTVGEDGQITAVDAGSSRVLIECSECAGAQRYTRFKTELAGSGAVTVWWQVIKSGPSQWTVQTTQVSRGGFLGSAAPTPAHGAQFSSLSAAIAAVDNATIAIV